MPLHTFSGESTFKYDVMTSPEAIDRINQLDTQASNANNKIQELEECNANLRADLTAECELTRAHRAKVDQRMVNFNQTIYHQHQLIMPLLRSRFVRFLNFFGRWFIYGTGSLKGQVFANTPENAKYGDPPLITRIQRRIMRGRSK